VYVQAWVNRDRGGGAEKEKERKRSRVQKVQLNQIDGDANSTKHYQIISNLLLRLPLRDCRSRPLRHASSKRAFMRTSRQMSQPRGVMSRQRQNRNDRPINRESDRRSPSISTRKTNEEARAEVLSR